MRVLLVFTILGWVQMGHATCGELLASPTIQYMISSLLKENAGREVNSELRARFDSLSVQEIMALYNIERSLRKFHVHFEPIRFFAQRSLLVVDFRISGPAKKVAQAVLELTHYDVVDKAESWAVLRKDLSPDPEKIAGLPAPSK